MKNALFVLIPTILFLFILEYSIDNDNVPNQVTVAFDKKFPSAMNATWEKTNYVDWKADFTHNGSAFSSNFTKEGNWIQTSHKIAWEELPADVISTYRKELNAYKIEKIEKTITRKATTYIFDLKKGHKYFTSVINPDGEIVTSRF